MAISNQECIEILNGKLSMLEELKEWNLEYDAIHSKYVVPSLEREIEVYRRAIRAFENASRRRNNGNKKNPTDAPDVRKEE